TPVLALGAAASAVVGSSVDAMLVTGVMTGNALIGGAQRMRAERALGDLLLGQRVGARRLPPPRAAHEEAFAALRSAGPEPVPAGELRPGGLILLRAQGGVPADARLLWAESLEVDEAALTGESVPVDKDVEATPGADPAARRRWPGRWTPRPACRTGCPSSPARRSPRPCSAARPSRRWGC